MLCCKTCIAAGSAALLIAVVGLSIPAVGQPEKAKPSGAPAAQPSGQPSPEDMMKMMEEAGAPGEQQKQMAAIVGEWDATVKSWWDPAGPAEESKGTMSSKAIFGGRYIQSEFKGEMMGTPFEGMAIWAFNKVSGKYESIWIDSMSTGIAWTEDGAYDGAKKAWSSTMNMWDPMTKQKCAAREVIAIKDANSHTMEMFMPGPDGKEFKNMEITYTRKAGAAKPATR